MLLSGGSARPKAARGTYSQRRRWPRRHAACPKPATPSIDPEACENYLLALHPPRHELGPVDPPVVIGVDLAIGDAGLDVWTCDFTADYVRINADYRT